MHFVILIKLHNSHTIADVYILSIREYNSVALDGLHTSLLLSRNYTIQNKIGNILVTYVCTIHCIVTIKYSFIHSSPGADMLLDLGLTFVLREKKKIVM